MAAVEDIFHLTTGDDKSDRLLRVAGTVAKLAEDIHDEMDRKRSGSSGEKKFLTEA
ncbi:MAG: hypothetical protein WCQ16_00625 [Verrucomicrobiae bacterium]